MFTRDYILTIFLCRIVCDDPEISSYFLMSFTKTRACQMMFYCLTANSHYAWVSSCKRHGLDILLMGFWTFPVSALMTDIFILCPCPNLVKL